MARSVSKYLYFNKYQIEHYINTLIYEDVANSFNEKRTTTIHKLNFNNEFIIHTGKWEIKKKFTKFHFNYKLGEFTKTRKPYYFRSKKKNVNKKYKLYK